MKIRSLALAGLFALSVTPAFAITLTENFTNDPALDDWQVFGNTNLLQWDSVNQDVAVTWSSTNVNSYFYHPLGVTLTSASNFMFSVDFTLQDTAIGTTPTKPQNFQVAFGLLNFAEATDPGFYIGSGYNAPDVVELDYFPADGLTDASVTTPLISSENDYAFNYTDITLAPGALYHAVLIYTADNQTLHTTLSSNGVPVGPLNDNILPAGFDGFNVDTLSINCYTDAGQDTNTYDNIDYAGSIIAHGTVSQLFFATPLPVTQIITATPGSIQFDSTTNWNYVLERSPDLQSWSDASVVTPGIAGSMTLADTNAPASQAFYRIRADRP
jgi:hypothetical protein